MSTICFPLVGGRAMRATRLDACGRPQYGDCAQVVTDGFVSIAASANVDDGDEISVVNANGKRCVSQPAKPTITSIGLEITFCEVDPDLYALVTGQSVVYDAMSGDAVGFRVNTSISPGDVGWALEVWSNVPGVACAPDSDPDAAPAGVYGYLLYPFLQGGVLGDYTIENAAVSFVVQNAVTKSGGQWGKGPYDVVMQAGGTAGKLIETIDKDDHFHVQLTEVAPPEPHCGCIPLDNPTWTAADTATAGAPGKWTITSSGSAGKRPADFAALQAAAPPVTAAPTTAWSEGQYVLLGDGDEAHWDGTAWAEGPAGVASQLTATGATAGTPGTFTPSGSATPANLAAMSAVTPSPATAWTTGQSVRTADSADVHWDGGAWVTGLAADEASAQADAGDTGSDADSDTGGTTP